jgi:hypothetical protein
VSPRHAELAPAGWRPSAAVTLPPGRRFAFRYLADGGRWHDDETAEAFEPDGVGGHNAVLHTWKQAPSRSPLDATASEESRALNGGATPSSSPVPAVVTVGPRRLVGWAC